MRDPTQTTGPKPQQARATPRSDTPARTTGVARALAALILAFAVTARASAEDTGTTLVIHAGTSLSYAMALDTAERVEVAIQRRGTAILPAESARAGIHALSHPPAAADTSDLDGLAEEARAALEHVAFGRSAAARRTVQEVFRRAERALESLNRETKTARHVLDACLALVRSAVDRDDSQAALGEAMRCRRLVPDVSPSEFLHPPTVLAVLTQADEQLRRMRIGRLTVESVPHNGCATYVNGRHLGVTPLSLDRAAPGEYRVQVECSHTPGRVHTVVLSEQPVSLRVDSELDRALRNEARVGLAYDSTEALEANGIAHALELGRSLGVTHVVLVGVNADGLTLTRLIVQEGALQARVRVDGPPAHSATEAALDLALDALDRGQIASRQTSAAAPAPRDTRHDVPPPAALPARAPRRRQNRWLASAGLAGAGSALFAAGIVFEHKQRNTEEAYQALDLQASDAARQLQRLDRAYTLESRLRWLGLGGSLLLVAAVPTAGLDVGDTLPWWSYGVGAVGVGLAIWGTTELAHDGDCELVYDDGGCARAVHTSGRAGLIFAGAAPLLAVPVSQLVALALGGSREHTGHVQLSPRPGGALLTFRREMTRW